jgi:zinc protease
MGAKMTDRAEVASRWIVPGRGGRPRLAHSRRSGLGESLFGRARVALVGVLVFWLAFGLAPARGQSVNWPSQKVPGPLPARDVKFPPYTLQKLSNGLQVVIVLHHEQPVVSLRLLVRAGSALDPPGRLGLASLTADLLDQGTTTRSAQEIADQIDFIGGTEGAGAAMDLTSVKTVVMNDSLQVGMRLLADMARHPVFSQGEVDRRRQRLLSTLLVDRDDPGYVADAVFDRLVYGAHAYGLPQIGTTETVAAITRDDLVDFHRRYFVPGNSILAIVGDVTSQGALEAAQDAFGDWEAGVIPSDDPVKAPGPASKAVVVNRPDAAQTEVRVGQIGIPRNSPDYLAMNIAMRLLGGEGSNRLHQVLRTERGLTYAAQADMNAFLRSGDFQAHTSTRSDATGEVIRLIVEEFWRLQRERVSEIELSGAKAYLTGSYPLTLETPDQIAVQVLNQLFYGLPLEQLQTFRERVNAVTADDIQRVARAYLRPDRLAVVLVGNANAFGSQLKRAGLNAIETLDLRDLDLTSADLRAPRGGKADRSLGSGTAGDSNGARGPQRSGESIAPDPQPGAGRTVLAAYRPQAQSHAPAITPDEGARAKALLDTVVAAKGGLDRLRAIKSITARTKTTAAMPGGDQEADATTVLVYPDHVWVEAKLPAGAVVQVYDGQHAWVRDPAGVHEVPAAQARDMATSLQRDTVSVLLAAEDGRVRARALPDVKDRSGILYHALELSSPALEPIVLYIDRQTNLIAKQAYALGGQGQPLVEELFSDYRPVDGVQVAFTAAVERAGQQVLERRITSIEFNRAVDQALFKRPAP